MISMFKLRVIWGNIRRIPRNIKKVIKWLPVIWGDADYDQSFLFEIMHFKIKNMREFFESDNTMAVDANKNAKRLFVCEKLLERLKDEVHLDIAIKPVERKWGEIQMRSMPSQEKGMNTLLIERENVKTEEDEVKERKDSRNAIKMENYLRRQDLQLLGKYLEKYSAGWWD